jgi:hypothetical protein
MKTSRHERSFMHFPRASELKADDQGFELYFPNDTRYGDRAGKLMSRYLWCSRKESCGEINDVTP